MPAIRCHADSYSHSCVPALLRAPILLGVFPGARCSTVAANPAMAPTAIPSPLNSTMSHNND
jgi:hypothetical protein